MKIIIFVRHESCTLRLEIDDTVAASLLVELEQSRDDLSKTVDV